MGTLDFSYQKGHLEAIKAVLRRRGLTMDVTDEWEVHGLKQRLGFEVYVGPVYKDGKYHCTVVIYPRVVYATDCPENWWKVTAAERIPVLKKS